MVGLFPMMDLFPLTDLLLYMLKCCTQFVVLLASLILASAIQHINITCSQIEPQAHPLGHGRGNLKRTG